MDLSQTLYQRHAVNTKWDNKLHFYADEINIMTIRLQEISLDNHYPEFEAGAAYFQEQLVFFMGSIEQITSEIRKNEQLLLQEIRRNPIAISQRKMDYQAKERVLVLFFEKNFSELKADFRWFCANWM